MGFFIAFTLAFGAHQALALGPGDFYCRELSDAIPPGLALGWDPEVIKTLSANPKLASKFAQTLRQEVGTPRFFKTGDGACFPAGGRTKGVCQQTVECAAFPKNLQKQVEAAYKKRTNRTAQFSGIDPQSKEVLIAALNAPMLDWKLSHVTCAASGIEVNGMPSCPTPDQCKADVSREGAEAITDPRGLVPALGVGSSSSGAVDTIGGAVK